MFGFINNKIRQEEKKNLLQNYHGEGIMSADGRLAFMIDQDKKVFLVFDENNKVHEYKKDDIINVSIEEINEKGYRRGLFSTLLWYKIGKLFDEEGGLQRVIVEHVTEEEIVTIQKLIIRVILKDLYRPYYDFIVYEKGLLANKKLAFELAVRWYSLINVLKHY